MLPPVFQAEKTCVLHLGVVKYVRGVVPTMSPRKTLCSSSYTRPDCTSVDNHCGERTVGTYIKWRTFSASSSQLPLGAHQLSERRDCRAICSQSGRDIVRQSATKRSSSLSQAATKRFLAKLPSSGSNQSRLWQGVCSTKWFKNHCFNSLQRSKSSFKPVAWP